MYFYEVWQLFSKNDCFFQDEFKEANSSLKKLPIEEILELQQVETDQKKRKDKLRLKILRQKGFCLNLESINEPDM